MCISNSISSKGSCVVKCENPRIICHPYFKSYFIRFGQFCYNGLIYADYKCLTREARLRIYDSFVKRFLHPFFKLYKSNPIASFNHDTLLSNYHFIGSDGIVYPMFLLVPCGKCKLCSYAKLSDLSARCALETYTSKCKPLFVTLTYDNDHLPEDGSVSLRDIQNFLKLLRINLNRFFASFNSDGKFVDAKISIRYLYASEYTPNNHRPHYHLLIWNVPYLPNGLSDYQKTFFESRLVGYPDSELNVSNRVFNSPFKTFNNCPIASDIRCDIGRVYGYDVLKKIIWCSWKKGFIKVEPSNDPTGRYVAKYIGKGSDVPKGCAPTFVRWSTRRGLGFDAFDKYFKVLLLANPSLNSLSFTDPKSGKIMNVGVPKYYRTLLAPSLSVVAKPFRYDLEYYHTLYCHVLDLNKHYHYIDNVNDFKHKHALVYNKFNLFVDLCNLSVRPLDKTHSRFVRRCCNLFCSDWNYDKALFERFINELDCLYNRLMMFDLDSLHLQDLINYKTLSAMYRSDYAKAHQKPLSTYVYQADSFYDKVNRQSRAND